MRRIAVINQKGGVGKTTTTANLGAALARRRQRVLLVDLDPQAHLTLSFNAEPDEDRPTVYDVLTGAARARDALLEVRENLRLMPAHTDLVAAESELVSVVGRELVLRDALEASAGDYDYLLIDCPPSLGILTLNALAAAGEVLIPLQPHFLALQGLAKLLETVSLVKARINSELRVCGIVLCLFEGGTRLAGEVVDDLRRFLESVRGGDAPWSEARLFDTVIRRNIKLAECPGHGLTILDYAPRSNGALDYSNLSAELVGDLEPAAAADGFTAEDEPAGRSDVSVAPEPTTTGACDPGDDVAVAAEPSPRPSAVGDLTGQTPTESKSITTVA